MKELFEKAEMKVIEFEAEDVITTSSLILEEDETPIIDPFHP